MFGRNKSGLKAACTNPSNPGGSGHLDSYLQQRDFPPAAPQPFAEVTGQIGAACRSDDQGAVLRITVLPGPNAGVLTSTLAAASPQGFARDWGLHRRDVALSQGSILRLIDAETQTWNHCNNSGEKQMSMTDRVNWPPEYTPDRSPIHAVNEIDIAAPPAKVWALLVGARRWGDYYPNASKVHITGDAATLSMGAQFTWTTADIELKSQVREFVPESRLAWDALSGDAKAYHTWLITPTAAGCHVQTEETQQGSLWIENDRKHPGGLRKVHQVWVEALKTTAEQG